MKRPIIKTVNGVVVNVRPLFPNTHMPHVEIIGTGASRIVGTFCHLYAFVQTPNFFDDEEYAVEYMPLGAVLYRIEIGYCPTPDRVSQLEQSVSAEFHFWNSNTYEPYSFRASYLGPANTKIIETTLPAPEGIVLN